MSHVNVLQIRDENMEAYANASRLLTQRLANYMEKNDVKSIPLDDGDNFVILAMEFTAFCFGNPRTENATEWTYEKAMKRYKVSDAVDTVRRMKIEKAAEERKKRCRKE